MNFLQLVNDLRRESSVSGSAVTTTISQTGEPGRLVNWIQTAYTEIQNIYFDWRFLRKKSSFTTTANLNIVTAPDDLNIWDVERFYDADGNPVEVKEEASLDYKLDETITGKPELIIIKSDNNLLLYPKPDAVYSVSYDYFRKPFELAADSDEPAFPSQYHKLIVARAMIFYGNYESAGEVLKQGTELYQTFLPRLIASQAPHKAQTYGRSDPGHIQVVAQ